MMKASHDDGEIFLAFHATLFCSVIFNWPKLNEIFPIEETRALSRGEHSGPLSSLLELKLHGESKAANESHDGKSAPSTEGEPLELCRNISARRFKGPP